MKNELPRRIVITVKDIAVLTGWGPAKCREFIRTTKEEQGLSKNDIFTIYHLSTKLKASVEDLQLRIR